MTDKRIDALYAWIAARTGWRSDGGAAPLRRDEPFTGDSWGLWSSWDGTSYNVATGRPVEDDEPQSAACSICDTAIPEDAEPLRMWRKDGWALVLCDRCVAAWIVAEPPHA